MRITWRVWVPAIVVLVAGGAFSVRAWMTADPDSVSVDDAVDRFRETSTSGQPRTSMGGQGPLAPGVYVYDTQGEEKVDAFGGDTHSYPSETVVIVTETDCGYTLAWTPIDGRSDSYTVCVASGAMSLEGSSNSHAFFRIAQEERFSCAAPSWWLPPSGTTSWTTTCRSEDRTTERNATMVGTEPVAVGADTIAAVHLRFDDVVSGDSTGTSTTEWWLHPDSGLPLRLVHDTSTQNTTVVGDVDFEEHIELILRSLAPRS